MDLQLSQRSTPSHGYFSHLAPKHSAMLCRRLRRRIGGSLALSLLTLLPAMAGAQTEDGPSLKFTSREYSVNPVAFLWRHGHPWFEDNARSTATLGNLYFDTVKAENSNGASNGLKFAVEEDPRRSDYQFCYESHHAEHFGTRADAFKDPGCYDVEVGVREDTGLFYLFLDRQIESSDRTIYRDYDVNHYITDFPARAVELSAEDGESGLKVYRDVLVGPSEPSGQLEDSTQGGGQGGASPRGAVPASRIHCDELDASESGGGAVLQQARYSGAVDQRRKASGEDDAAQLPQVPIQRGSAVADHHCLQPGKPLAAIGAAEENRQLVLDQLAAAIGQNRRTPD